VVVCCGGSVADGWTEHPGAGGVGEVAVGNVGEEDADADEGIQALADRQQLLH
jgi:hypothetical protein